MINQTVKYVNTKSSDSFTSYGFNIYKIPCTQEDNSFQTAASYIVLRSHNTYKVGYKLILFTFLFFSLLSHLFFFTKRYCYSTNDISLDFYMYYIENKMLNLYPDNKVQNRKYKIICILHLNVFDLSLGKYVTTKANKLQLSVQIEICAI